MNGAPHQPIILGRSRQRAGADNTDWLRQQTKLDSIMKSVFADGYAAGERDGAVAAWHWGTVCGVMLGAVSTGMLWAAWPLIPAWIAAVQGWLA